MPVASLPQLAWNLKFTINFRLYQATIQIASESFVCLPPNTKII